MKILCICPIGIGNYLMCYPAFAALKKRAAGHSLHLLALRHSIAGIAAGDPLWSGIHVFDPDKIKAHPGEPAKVLSQLWRLRFDASLSFFPSNTWQYFALPFLCGIRRRYGFHYNIRRLSRLWFLATDTVLVDPSLHDVHQNLRLSGFYLGESLDMEPVVFPRLFDDGDSKWAIDFLKEKSGASTFIAVHPGSSVEHGMDVKRWPADRFAALADRACAATGACALVLGGTEESDVKRTVAAAMKAPACVVDAVSIQKTTALLSRCRCCLCNDSGIMHLAACAGVPTAAVFGPTDEKRNGPFGKSNLVIRKPMQGFPVYTASNVGDRSTLAGTDPKAALLALTPDEAWSQLESWL